ncbi:MAG: hypothetical protein R2845_06515 [Thermomicrobiales bacterium]
MEKDLREVDEVVGDLIAYYEGEGRAGHPRLRVRHHAGQQARSPQSHLPGEGLADRSGELGRDMFDPGQSRVFAVADHQLAHIYVRDPTLLDEVKALVEIDGRRIRKCSTKTARNAFISIMTGRVN